MEDVEFRPYPKAPDRYLVSNDGRVVSLKYNGKAGVAQEMKGMIGRNGYRIFGIFSIAKYAHRLVAETFIPNPLALAEVNHKDGNKLNNHVDNLEWVSKSDNVRHAHATGLSKKQGSHNKRAKINEEKALAIWNYCLAHAEDSPRLTHGQIANAFGVSYRIAEKIRTGIAWRHVCK